MNTRSSYTTPLERLRADKRLVIRDPLVNKNRVAVFAELYQSEGLTALPPIIVLDLADGILRVVDGIHRLAALRKLKATDALVAPLITDGQMPIDEALDAAIECAVVSATNLTPAELRTLALRLLRGRPGMSHREVARKLGVSHTTVNTWAHTTNATENPDSGRVVERTARRLVKSFDALNDAIADFDEAVASVAEAFATQFDDPVSWAQYFADVAGGAAEILTP
jgi:hypothetical protein